VVRLLAYLAGLPQMDLASCFLSGPDSYALPESIDIDVGAYIPRWRGEARWQQFWVWTGDLKGK
jgi:hypothetical protein